MVKTPIDFLVTFFNEQNIEQCELSAYVYIPRSVEDRRRIFRIKAEDINQFIEQLKLESDEELAVHSKVYREGIEYHIPMIDFTTAETGRLEDIRPLLTQFNISRGIVFSSGDSYHLYGDGLLQGKERWIDFLGVALRDYTSHPPLIDSRWVGHRLIAGYSSLRLTNNSGKYKKSPEFEFEIR